MSTDHLAKKRSMESGGILDMEEEDEVTTSLELQSLLQGAKDDILNETSKLLDKMLTATAGRMEKLFESRATITYCKCPAALPSIWNVSIAAHAVANNTRMAWERDDRRSVRMCG